MHKHLPILVAEDDANDVLLLKRAFLKNGINNPVYACQNGEQAIAYLRGKEEFGDRSKFPFPTLLITDLKMPRSDGFEILSWLRSHPKCHLIPVLVLSASREDKDIRRAYRMGANAYLHKPAAFEDLAKMVKLIFDFWGICETPSPPEHCDGNAGT